jgi:hypothetical protein
MWDYPPFFFAACVSYVDLMWPKAVRIGLEAVMEIVSHPYHEVGSESLLSRRNR